MEEHPGGVRLGFVDGTWDITFPAAAGRLGCDEDDLWCWEFGGASGRVRLRREPTVQFEVDVTNLSGDAAMVDPPSVTFTAVGTPVPWFAGAAGEVLNALPQSSVLWVQQRGACIVKPGGFGFFPEPLLLRPGQTSSAAWRRHVLPAATLAPEPTWVPRQRYLQRGEVLEVEHTDAALVGDGLDLGTAADGSVVEGTPGLHELLFLDARGTALVEVGWFLPLEELAASPSALATPDANLVAWLLSCGVGGPPDPDALDVALAEALEVPSAWGVLAGMRAVTMTDLPVAAEVREAAAAVWAGEGDDALRRLLVTHALLSGWEPETVGQWLRSPRVGVVAAPGMTAQEMLASVGFGRITSSTAICSGREVAVAGVWLSTVEESAMAVEWEHAVDVARRRLLCALSERPVATDIAWLLSET